MNNNNFYHGQLRKIPIKMTKYPRAKIKPLLRKTNCLPISLQFSSNLSVLFFIVLNNVSGVALNIQSCHCLNRPRLYSSPPWKLKTHHPLPCLRAPSSDTPSIRSPATLKNPPHKAPRPTLAHCLVPELQHKAQL